MSSKICSLHLVHCYKHEFFFLITGASCCSDVSFSTKMQGGMQAEFLIEEDLALISSAKRHPPTLMRALQFGPSGNQRILETVVVCSN